MKDKAFINALYCTVCEPAGKKSYGEYNMFKMYSVILYP